MIGDEEAERLVLDKYEAHLKERGYRLNRRPRGADVPDFLGGFLPDAIATGRTPSLLIEVIRKGAPHAEEKVRRLNMLLRDRDDWRLEVLYSGETQVSLQASPSDAIDELLSSARRLAVPETRASLLLTWSGLEALARRLEPLNTARPQSPGRVVEILAGAGHVTPSEADRLRKAVLWRNQLIHGDMTTAPSPSAVIELVDIATELLRMLRVAEGAQ